MLLDPHQLQHNLDRVEEIERASLRHVVQALYDYRQTAKEVFHAEIDLVADVGEDITREALDRMGMARIDQRLFGKMDYKRACYLFHPDFAIKQALFVDSKAEKVEGCNTATLQTSQFSMVVRQIRAGETVEVSGKLPARYNPTVFDTIWLAGRNAPTRGEEFRVRLDLRRLKAKANWRVQLIPITTGEFRWEE